MLSLGTTKLAINIVSGLGVSKIVSDVIKNNTVVLTASQKFFVNAGGLVLGSMIVDKAVAHVNQTIDKIVVEWSIKEKQNQSNDISGTS